MMDISGGIAALCGGMAGLVFGCVPGMHVVFILVLASQLLPYFAGIDGAPFLIGIVSGFCMSNAVPLALWNAPDDNKAFASPAAAALRRAGSATEATQWSANGALSALALVALLYPVTATFSAPPYQSILACRQILPWILLVGLLVSMMAPRNGEGYAPAGLTALLGLVLSGSLGALLLWRSPVHPVGLARTFAPALIGIFTIPQLMCSPGGVTADAPRISDATGVCAHGHNLLCAIWSGLLVASLPAAGGASAGFICSQFRERSARLRMFAQGACTAGMLATGLIALLGCSEYGIATPPHPTTVAYGIALATGAAYLVLPHLVRLLARVVPDAPPTHGVIALCIVVIVLAFTGLAGLFTMLAAGGIGLLLRSASLPPQAGLSLIIVPLILSTGGF